MGVSLKNDAKNCDISLENDRKIQIGKVLHPSCEHSRSQDPAIYMEYLIKKNKKYIQRKQKKASANKQKKERIKRDGERRRKAKEKKK